MKISSDNGTLIFQGLCTCEKCLHLHKFFLKGKLWDKWRKWIKKIVHFNKISTSKANVPFKIGLFYIKACEVKQFPKLGDKAREPNSDNWFFLYVIHIL